MKQGVGKITFSNFISTDMRGIVYAILDYIREKDKVEMGTRDGVAMLLPNSCDTCLHDIHPNKCRKRKTEKCNSCEEWL